MFKLLFLLATISSMGLQMFAMHQVAELADAKAEIVSVAQQDSTMDQGQVATVQVENEVQQAAIPLSAGEMEQVQGGMVKLECEKCRCNPQGNTCVCTDCTIVP